jgi:C1q domain
MSKVKIQGNASGTGIFTVAAPATNTDRTITLPDTSSTLLAPDSTGSIQLDYAGSNNYLRFISSANYVGRNSSTGDIWLNAQGGQSVILGVNDTTHLKVDGNGRVTMPNQPSFEVGGAGGLTFTSVGANEYKLTYASIYHNVGNYYSTSTGHFTAPVTGSYLFQAVMMGVNTTSPHITFSINGSAQGGGGNYPNNNLYEHGSYSQNAYWIRTVHIFRLQANDYVRVQSYAYNSVGSPDRCYFGGHLLG